MTSIDYTSPSDEWVRGIDVHSLLPQQEPFVMIGRLEHFDMQNVKTSTLITSENIFVEKGCMSATGLIENIAQTCAARIGYINKYILKKGIQVGFIGSVRNLNVYSLPKVGTEIQTEVSIQNELFGKILINSTVQSEGNILVTASMTIAISEEA